MPTVKEYFLHIRNAHNLESEQHFLRLLYDHDANIEAVHTFLHEEPADHSHEADGSIANENKTVLGDKSITRTRSGWALDGTAVEILQELNTLVNNQRLEISIQTTYLEGDDKITGKMRSQAGNVSVNAGTFLEIVRLLIGETYFKFDEQQQPEEPTP